MGPTFGLNLGSFRAELHGMLSALLFLELHLRFFDVLLSDSISPLFHCDNLGLVKRVTYAMHRSWDNPNHCLSSEHDVESGIVNILNRLPFKLTCLHVKGHQDDDAPVAELPWEAQMGLSCRRSRHRLPQQLVCTVQGRSIHPCFASIHLSC
jgi:hypothetical protein